MPFKIVETIERGKSVLTTVPSKWEKDGILYWPKNQDRLRRIEELEPEGNWITMNCILRKSNLPSFKKAEHEIGNLCNSESDTEEVNQRNSGQKQNTNNKRKQKGTYIVLENEPREAIKLENLIQDSLDPLTPQDSLDDVTSEMPDNSPLIMSEILTKVNLIIRNTKTICESIKTIQDNQQKLFDGQQAVMEKLSKICSHFDQLQNSELPERTERRQSIPTKRVKDIEDIDNLEKSLDNPAVVASLKKKYSVLFRQARGEGLNSAYVLVDSMFERSFFLKVSWSGGSRTEESKFSFKNYTKVMNLFFEIVNESDDTFTLMDCFDFFKNVIKNSRKRLESKQLRASRRRTRRKRGDYDYDDVEEPFPYKKIHLQENGMQSSYQDNETSAEENTIQAFDVNIQAPNQEIPIKISQM